MERFNPRPGARNILILVCTKSHLKFANHFSSAFKVSGFSLQASACCLGQIFMDSSFPPVFLVLTPGNNKYRLEQAPLRGLYGWVVVHLARDSYGGFNLKPNSVLHWDDGTLLFCSLLRRSSNTKPRRTITPPAPDQAPAPASAPVWSLGSIDVTGYSMSS